MSTNEAYQNSRPIELKCWLVRHGLSQPKLARQLGITRQYLSFILKSQRKAQHIRRQLVVDFGLPAELVSYSPEERKAA
jgi:transcriptional regulator with XRE-family HTH domain